MLVIQWTEVFLPSVPVVETFVRGSVVYLAIVILLRVVLKRESGALSIGDVLTVVLLGDASQNAMASNHKSVADGLLLVCTILFWNYGLDWMGFHFRWFERLMAPPALRIVRDGKLLRRNMRRELITEEELMSHIRKQGLRELSEVKEAFMESDGQISIIPVQSPGAVPGNKDKRPI